MPTPLTDADKVIRNDTGLAIVQAIQGISAPAASNVPYDNTTSGLTADDVQEAIDELKTANDTKMDKVDPTGTGSFSLNRASGSTVGTNSVAIGNNNTASGESSFAEGNSNTASGIRAHAEGSATTASGNYSHTEGAGSIASGQRCHAEGSGTTASGDHSHAEGSGTTASGDNGSHSEGYTTEASGRNSHCEGRYTISNHRSQHVFGEYNIADTSTAVSTARGNYVEIVGKGSDNENRSNARTLDWSGNEVLAGGLKLHDNQNAATLIVSNDIAANGGALDCSVFTDGSIIFLYRNVDNTQGIYIKSSSRWLKVIPILPLSYVSINGYVITNNDTNYLLRSSVITV